MRSAFEEYGGVIIEAICAAAVIGIVTAMINPDIKVGTIYLPSSDGVVTLHSLLLDIFQSLMP